MCDVIDRQPNVHGGAACIRDVPVWWLVMLRQLGASDLNILLCHPSLTAANLQTAYDYNEANLEEVCADRSANETREYEPFGGRLAIYVDVQRFDLEPPRP